MAPRYKPRYFLFAELANDDEKGQQLVTVEQNGRKVTLTTWDRDGGFTKVDLDPDVVDKLLPAIGAASWNARWNTEADVEPEEFEESAPLGVIDTFLGGSDAARRYEETGKL